MSGVSVSSWYSYKQKQNIVAFVYTIYTKEIFMGSSSINKIYLHINIIRQHFTLYQNTSLCIIAIITTVFMYKRDIYSQLENN